MIGTSICVPTSPTSWWLIASLVGVQSRHQLARLLVEEVGPGLPLRPDELGWCEPFEGLQTTGVVVGVQEQLEVPA